ncbi:hypothetical protein M426DRAFT_320403 [Hypoxylon sp. CI-4A]|nr:hypothetical protein M426DRAFT_320403 [Hypoxylon sp. CI-4A]
MRRYRNSEEENRRRKQAAEAGRQRAAAERPLQLLTNTPNSVSNLPSAGLGRLAILPNEVIMMILNNCSLRSLIRLERVNKAAKQIANLLYDFPFVKETARGAIQRARPEYRHIMFKILKITTFRGLRQLLTTYDCELCRKPGSFRMVKVKVLCENCYMKKPGRR